MTNATELITGKTLTYGEMLTTISESFKNTTSARLRLGEYVGDLITDPQKRSFKFDEVTTENSAGLFKIAVEPRLRAGDTLQLDVAEDAAGNVTVISTLW